MIVVQLLGGLGNQMFQYACGRALALRTGKKLILDRCQCTENLHLRPYALHNFNIQTQTIQSMDELKRIGQEFGIADIVVRNETGFHFDPQIVAIQDNVILANGYWQSEKYFSDMAGSIRQDFIPYLGSVSEESLSMAKEMRENTSIALHIRRGDYSNPANAKKHGILPIDYYRKAMEYFDSKHKDAKYYVFSDDIDWCNSTFANQSNVSVVAHHASIEAHEDLWLMSQCKHNIIANSTYSWWGAWLNANPAKIVITPERWFADAPFDTKDLVPEEWVKMPVGSAINIKHTIAILYICTGKYHMFWEEFYKSAEKNLLTDHEKTYFVFTDYQELPFGDHSNVKVIYQEKLGWPDDTLMRFHIFRKVEHELEKYDYIFFFNANLLIVAPVGEEILPNDQEGGLCALWHPCFYNEIDNRKYTYERNQNSLAYIPIGEGKRYYAGGLNGGTSTAYLQLIRQLAENIERDKENNIIALWHDESHLNKYLLTRSVRVLSPLYGWPEEFPPNHQVKIMIKDKIKYGGHEALRSGVTQFGVSMGERCVGVCILFFNKLGQTMECIESLLDPGVNIYVLNNGSEPLFRKQLGDFCRNFENVKIIDVEANLGVAVGRNVLVESSIENWLLFVDSDIVVKSKDWLKKFWVHVDHSKEIEVFVPKTFNTHENTYIRPVYCSIDSLNRVIFNSVTSEFTNLFPGGASFVSRDLFKRLGVYDDKMFVGFEDFELAIRGVKSGEPIKVQLIDDIELIHNHRYLPCKEDQDAVSVRYNSKLITDSHDRVLEKHGVFIGRDFEPWLAEQIRQMTQLRN